MSIDCLFDTHSIIKIYVPLKGHEVVKYLFKKSPTAIINIANTQIVETISIFYKSRREGAFSSDKERDSYIDTFLNDIKIGKIKTYDFAEEHIKDFDVYQKITDIRPPNNKPSKVLVPEWDGYYQEFKEPADAIDTIMLLIMREMHLLTQKETYLISSDGHVKLVAKALQLRIIDPELTPIAGLPEQLLLSRDSRINVNLRTICIDCDNNLQMDTAKAVNICRGGLCLETRQPLGIGKRLDIKRLIGYDGFNKAENISAKVVWSNPFNQEKFRAGLQFSTPLVSSLSFS